VERALLAFLHIFAPLRKAEGCSANRDSPCENQRPKATAFAEILHIPRGACPVITGDLIHVELAVNSVDFAVQQAMIAILDNVNAATRAMVNNQWPVRRWPSERIDILIKFDMRPD